MGFISDHIIPLIITNLGGGHSDIQTYTQFADKINFQKQGVCQPVAGVHLV